MCAAVPVFNLGANLATHSYDTAFHHDYQLRELEGLCLGKTLNACTNHVPSYGIDRAGKPTACVDIGSLHSSGHRS